MKKKSLYDIEYFQKIKDAQKNRKNKLKKRRFLLVIGIVFLAMYFILPISRINSISIVGNEIYNDEEVMELANIHNKEFTILKPKFLIESKLNQTSFFSNVEVSKDFFGNIKIDVEENNLLYYTIKDKKVVFFDEKNNMLSFEGNQIKKYQALVPELYSEVDEEIQIKLVEKLSQLDESVINEISQIIYNPKSYDKENFRFVMSGDKEIYINANLDYIVKVGANYHNFAANTNYSCSSIEYIDTENKAIVKKCK